MVLNDAGQMVENEWLKIPDRFIHTRLHEYVVMPNHFHGILEITHPTDKIEINVEATLVVDKNEKIENDQNDGGQPPGVSPTLGNIIGAFHSIVTVKYIDGVKNLGWPRFDGKLMQRNYYEHIIRNELAYRRISRYIIDNPLKWDEDKFHK